jgi:Fe-S cluster biogenesis protein NfuA
MSLAKDIRGAVEHVVARLRENLQADGCDIELEEISEDGRVTLCVGGGMSCCPMSHLALAVGLDGAIKDEVPSVKTVEVKRRR